MFYILHKYNLYLLKYSNLNNNLLKELNNNKKEYIELKQEISWSVSLVKSIKYTARFWAF